MSAPAFTPGQFVVRRRHSRWSWATFEFGRLVKVTDRTAIVHRFRDERVPLSDIIAAFPTVGDAERLVQSLDGVAGTYREKASAAERDCSARKKAAAEAAEKTAERVIAKARGEQ